VSGRRNSESSGIRRAKTNSGDNPRTNQQELAMAKTPVAKKKPSKPAPRNAVTKKSAAPKKSAALKKPSRSAKKAVAAKPPSLGRPKVTGEELLYLLFKEDYHARQVFEFLRVNTVKELEQFSATEIIRRLSQPVRTTVERIRQTLAQYNRCLSDDLEYALERKAEREGEA
jgi:hypothetical protein